MIVIAFVLMGLGWALVLGPSAVTALSAVPAEQSGLAVGATWTFHNIGGAIGLAISMVAFRAAAGGLDTLDLASPAFLRGYHAAMCLIAGTSLASALAMVYLARTRRRAASTP